MKKNAQYGLKYHVFTKKTLLVMKISTLLLFLALHVSAKDFAQQKITLNVKSSSFKTVLKSIEKQTTYRFFYSDDIVSGKKQVSIIVNDAPIEKVMEILLDQSALSWKQMDANKIVIAAVTKIDYAVKAIPINGTVKNSKGELLVGATIKEVGTNNIALTDNAGNFSMNVNDNSAKLEISIVGYRTQQVSVASKNIVVVLFEEAKNLEDVVVIGFGTKVRKSISTSISSISAKDVSLAPVADVAQALQGKISGLSIIQGSGAPGGTGGSQLRIRGISSINLTNNPLIVVDGYPLPDAESDNILNSFGTGEIERVDVLKDAGATAVYGVRGSNGVIVITTKRGKIGKSNLNVEVYRGIQEAWKLPSSLNAKQYAIANTEARIASGLAPISKLQDFNAIERQYGTGTDWLGEIFRRAAIQNVVMTAAGGSENAQYLFSAGYFKQDGIVYNTDFERFNLRFNGDVKVNSRIKFGNSLALNKFIEHGTDTYSPFNSNIILALTAPPTTTPRNPDGTYAGGNGSLDGYDEPNPIYNLEVPQNKNVKYRATGNIFTEIGLLKGLKFKAMFGGDFTIQEINSLNVATPSSGGRPITLSSYFVQKTINPDYLSEYTLTYDKTFLQKHKLVTFVGYTFQESRYSYVNGSRGNGTFIYNVPGLNNTIFTPTSISQINNGAEDGVYRRLASYVGRINYDYDNRGYFGFSARRDGSSNFAPQNRFADFYAFSAAWRLSQEQFIKNIKWINELKIRASFGSVGNQNIPSYKYLQLINQGFQYTLGNSSGAGGIVSGAAPSSSYNPEIKWEKNQQTNVGIDASFLKNRLTIALDVYQRKSKDLIINIAPPLVSGTYENVPFNTGTLQNRGIDLTLYAEPYQSKNFKWTVNSVFSSYKNKITSLGISSLIDNGGFPRITGGSLRSTVNLPINYFYGFVTEGIFQNVKEIASHAVQTLGSDPTKSTAPGDIKFKDINGDGIINDQDRTNIGNSNPTFTFGLTNTFTYKNLELMVFIQGSKGNKVLNFTRWYTEGGVSNGNYSNKILGRWTGEGTSNTIPRLILDDPNGNNRVSDRFVEDASYLRIKNVRLQYSLPSNFTGKMGVKNTKLYVSAQNLVTATNYTGFDPEVGGGVDYGFYPQARTFIAGITVEL